MAEPIRGIVIDRVAAWHKRLANGILIGLPGIGTIIAPVWLIANASIYRELLAFAIGYVVIGLGIGMGFHRLFAHRSYQPIPIVRWVLAIAGSLAGQGSLMRWVMDHRRHHAKTDLPGDTHSPHFTAQGQPLAGWRGFAYAHIGWMFDATVTDPKIYARDLLADPFYRFFEKTHWLWFALSLLIPALAGYLSGGLEHAVGCFLWGGCVKITLFQNVVWAVNSIGHLRGVTAFPEAGQSKNNRILAWATLGDGWHNNHHHTPRSAFQGFQRYETDVSGAIIRWMARAGWARDVIVSEKHFSRQDQALPPDRA